MVDSTNGNSFKNLHYLINDYTIRTVLTPVHALTTSDKISSSYLGIAPDFSKSNRFSSIPFSTKLVSSKANDFNGTFSHSMPSNSLEAGIIHIATHVVNDTIHPYNTSIQLGERDSLTISDFAKFKINSSLVILNGCQTGKGRYVQSEGSITLARAFFLHGVSSVITTLWSVDDKATADVLSLFYENIEEGKELDVSLRGAKIDFIHNAGSDDLANPFYWAGLQLTGNSKSLMTSKNSNAVLYLGIVLLLIISISGYWKFKSRF